jgi:molecular chaperone GrpE
MAHESDTRDEPLAAEPAADSFAAGGAQPAPDATPAEAELARERDEYLARWQRAAADYKNLRRRTADEIEAAVRRAMLPLFSSLLLVLDHLDLALQAKSESPDARSLATGVKLTRDQLLQALQQQGVEPFEATGAFDPARHEAVSTRVERGHEPGAILELVRRGYTWRGQVLRHAHVVVARGAGEAPADAQAGPEPASAAGESEDA